MRATPITDPLCLEGLTRVARSLRRAWADGTDLDARTDMSLGALFGGMALANAGLGAVHGFAAAIGGRFEAPHGAVCAALLPQWCARISMRLRRALRRRRRSHATTAAARAVTGRPQARSGDLVDWLLRLRDDLHIPGLGTCNGIRDEDMEPIVAAAAQASSMRANPIALGTTELHDILSSAM